jgi:hypothetical protein
MTNRQEELLIDLVKMAEGSPNMEQARLFEQLQSSGMDGTQMLVEFEHLLAALKREAGAESVPDHVIRAVAGLLPAGEKPLRFAEMLGQWAAGLERKMAELVFDSFATPAVGVRDVSASASRQMLFSFEGVDIDVRVSPQADAWRVSGQILGSHKEGAAKLVGDQGLEAISALNDHGEFVFFRLPRGKYSLEVVQPGCYLAVPGFGVGEQAPGLPN